MATKDDGHTYDDFALCEQSAERLKEELDAQTHTLEVLKQEMSNAQEVRAQELQETIARYRLWTGTMKQCLTTMQKQLERSLLVLLRQRRPTSRLHAYQPPSST